MTREEAIRTLNFGAWWDNLNPEMSDADSEPLFEALDMAISALKQQQEQESKPLNGWISVKDRLPEKDGNYLATACDEGCSVREGIWCSTVVVVAEYYEGSWTWYDVTHWMPMPEPPERGKMEE